MGTYRLRVAAVCAVAVIGLAGCGSGSGTSGNGKSIQIWEGFTGVEAKTFAKMVTQYENTHPGVKVSSLFVNNDYTLQKVQTAVGGGTAVPS